MQARSTPMRRSPMLRSTKPLKRFAMVKRAPKKRAGLGAQVLALTGQTRNVQRKEPSFLRSEQHRKNVAALGCLVTGQSAQACHVNFGKGMGMKVCDSLCFPLRPDLHRAHDQGGVARMHRLRLEWEYVDATRALLIQKNQWPSSVEAHYQRAIEPLRRVVHGDVGQ